MYTKLSKYLSYLLRHHPEDLNLFMDENGFVSVKELIDKINNSGKYSITFNILEEIVKTDLKKRYAFSEDKTLIKANQGHSFNNIKIMYESVKPPNVLYHGTSLKNYESIKNNGISSMKRQYVHLSFDFDTALEVGKRHGKPIVLVIDSLKMYEDNVKFYKADNGVWLTDFIDKKYISCTISED